MNPSQNEIIDLENRQRTERLQAKISQLKHFAVDIERETNEHNRLLDDTSKDFEGVFAFLKKGQNRIFRLLKSSRSNRKLMIYFILILVSILFIFYYLITKSLKTPNTHE